MTACKQCGREVEEARRCYATPVCYACLPPPKPLPIALTESQRVYLSLCAIGCMSPWDAASTTVSALKKAGLIERDPKWTKSAMYIATDAGRAWLLSNGDGK